MCSKPSIPPFPYFFLPRFYTNPPAELIFDAFTVTSQFKDSDVILSQLFFICMYLFVYQAPTLLENFD